MENKPLPEKYRKALSLLEEGNLTYKEISKRAGINTNDFYDLIEGTCVKLGTRIQQQFSQAFSEINKRRDKEIRDLVRFNKKETHLLINAWLVDKKKLKNVDEKTMSTLVSVANALSKSTPNVEIGSFTYQKGLSPEDIYAEFKRLTGLASDRGAIQGSPKGGAGEVPLATRPRIATSEEPEDPILPTEPEA